MGIQSNSTISPSGVTVGNTPILIPAGAPSGPGTVNPTGGIQTSAQVSFRMQGGNYDPGQGFIGLDITGPPENPNNLLNFSFIEINDNAFHNMQRFNFDFQQGLFVDGISIVNNISLPAEMDSNGPIAHDPNNFAGSSISSTQTAASFGLGYEIEDTGLNMSMRNYRAAFLKINYRNAIRIDGINHNTQGVMLPADDTPLLADPFRVGELAAGAFFPGQVSVINQAGPGTVQSNDGAVLSTGGNPGVDGLFVGGSGVKFTGIQIVEDESGG